MISPAKQTRLENLRQRIDRTDRALRRIEQIEGRYPWIRLWVFLFGLTATWLAARFGPGWAGWATAGLAIAAFAIVVGLHRKVSSSLHRYQVVRSLMATQVARMELDWQQIPAAPVPSADPTHPFAADLNVTGEKSIHQLLDTAASRGGSLRLRDWLLATQPDPPAILQRQELVKTLIALPGFRTRLALSSALVSEGENERWDGERLLAWLDRRSSGKSLRPFLLLLATLAAINLVLFLLFSFGRIPPYWIATLILYLGLQFSRFSELRGLFSDSSYLAQTLNRFRAVLEELESYPYFRPSALASLCEPFWQPTRRPSQYLRRIARIATAASLQSNQFAWLLVNLVVPWDLYFAYRLQLYREEMRSILPGWLDTWYELEALTSLANYAFLNPDSTFPELLEPGETGSGQPVFSGTCLGHPLIPDRERISNDFDLQTLGEIAIITGSNMSGKSTFLRTLGANLCLAYAGGTVAAARLKILPYRVFTCIHVSDSLSDGISYFYAEVRRLKALLSALRQPEGYPLFFLIDEIFRGTNNRERQIGSWAYVRALAGGRGTGAISTHDLELVHLADAVPGVHNYHFQEDILDNRMVFDYRLRPGPSPTTNALKIMELEGLPVNGGASLLGDRK